MGSKPKWDRHSILAEFRRRGISLTTFAKDNGRRPNHFRNIWTRWNRVDEKLIADFLGDPVDVVWPERYPISPNRIFISKKPAALESQKSNASSDTRAAA